VTYFYCKHTGVECDNEVDEIMEKISLLDGIRAVPSSDKWSVIKHVTLIYNLVTRERDELETMKKVLFSVV